MKKSIVLSTLCLLALAAHPAMGEEAQGMKKLARSKVVLKFDLQELGMLPKQQMIARWLCSGSEVLPLPSLGECPSQPGYTTAGIATCYQTFRVPKKATFERTEGGLLVLTCELDWENAEPLGDLECDYSRCLYIKEPEFPWPGTIIP